MFGCPHMRYGMYIRLSPYLHRDSSAERLGRIEGAEVCVGVRRGHTCVSSRHSRKCVTILKLKTKLKTNFPFLDPYFWTIYFQEL